MENIIENALPLGIETKVYSVMGGKVDEEFYSYVLPALHLDKIEISGAFLKGIVSEEIFDSTVEENFLLPSINSVVELPLSSGILLKQYNCGDLKWLTRSQEEAQNIIKDKVIIKYQQLVPQLMNQIKNIETSIKNKGSNDIIDF